MKVPDLEAEIEKAGINMHNTCQTCGRHRDEHIRKTWTSILECPPEYAGQLPAFFVCKI